MSVKLRIPPGSDVQPSDIVRVVGPRDVVLGELVVHSVEFDSRGIVYEYDPTSPYDVDAHRAWLADLDRQLRAR